MNYFERLHIYIDEVEAENISDDGKTLEVFSPDENIALFDLGDEDNVVTYTAMEYKNGNWVTTAEVGYYGEEDYDDEEGEED